ncbi:MAG: hypothetical protein PHQ43_13370 [Dehalococcoidales bacterium]|nr:hypothetical protein [Dehalococcoidales bacterium]
MSALELLQLISSIMLIAASVFAGLRSIRKSGEQSGGQAQSIAKRLDNIEQKLNRLPCSNPDYLRQGGVMNGTVQSLIDKTDNLANEMSKMNERFDKLNERFDRFIMWKRDL